MTTTIKKVSLGLQGGGTYGAYTWGVLDRLLQEERLEIVASCGHAVIADAVFGRPEDRAAIEARTQPKFVMAALVLRGVDQGTQARPQLGRDNRTLARPVFVGPGRQAFVFGAIDFSAALVRAGKLLGYRVTVCDARPIFATTKRFPDADEVVVDWPHRWLEKQHVDPRTVIAVLTHDPEFDVPALKVAVGTDAGYIGAMGSRRTHDNRVIRLKEAGLTDDEISRIHSPIGLDLGARTPEETAISIAAEIVQARWGGSGEHLTRTSGPIHPGVER